MPELWSLQGPGLYRETGLPAYGRQDLGYSPGGAQDRFSLLCGRIALDDSEGISCLEMITPPRITFQQDCVFILSGGAWAQVRLEGRRTDALQHGRVHTVHAGETLLFRDRLQGYRTYISALPVSAYSGTPDRCLPGFADRAHWPDPRGYIRILPGPESHSGGGIEALTGTYWRIGRQSDGQGLRLEPLRAAQRTAQADSMISSPVCDGCIQMSPAGPLVLMRERQTVGGYPRLAVVAEPDIDRLAQLTPGQAVRFRQISRDDALQALQTWQDDLDRLRRLFRQET